MVTFLDPKRIGPVAANGAAAESPATDPFLAALAERAATLRRELVDAREALRAAQDRLAAAELRAGALNPVLALEGMEPLRWLAPADPPPVVVPGPSTRRPSGHRGYPGNRSPLMPDRRAEFAALGLDAAVYTVLTRATGPLDLEAILRAIFDDGDAAKLAHARQITSQSLGRIERRGTAERVAGGLHRLVVRVEGG